MVSILISLPSRSPSPSGVDAAAASSDSHLLQIVAVIISLMSMVVSLAVAIYTVGARPIPLLMIHKARQGDGGKWVFRGDLLHLFNVGRRPLAVQAVGVRYGYHAAGGGTTGPAGEFEFLGQKVSNPSLPCVIPPGEMLTFRFPAGFVEEAQSEANGYGVEWIRGRRRNGRPSTKWAYAKSRHEELPATDS